MPPAARGGRPARPAALKLLNGRTADTDSGGRKVEPGPALSRQAPTAPGWLSLEARSEWDRIVPELARLRILSQVSAASLAAYCTCWAHYREVAEMYAANRCTTATMVTASRELRQWAREFGLTPSAEGSLHPPELPDDGDPFA